MTSLAEITDGVVLDLVRSAVATVLEVPVTALESGTPLAEVGADSLAMIEIVEIVEEQLRAKGTAVRIDDDTLAQMHTLDDVVAAALSAVSAVRMGAAL